MQSPSACFRKQGKFMKLNHNDKKKTIDGVASSAPMTASNAKPTSQTLLRLPQVLARFPVARSTWYSGMRTGIYPSPIPISRRAVPWRGPRNPSTT